MYSVEYQMISEPTPVMISIISTDSGSICRARSMRRSPDCTHVHRVVTSVRSAASRPIRVPKRIAVSTNEITGRPRPSTRV